MNDSRKLKYCPTMSSHTFLVPNTMLVEYSWNVGWQSSTPTGGVRFTTVIYEVT
jgi:hypothetical protein